MKKVYSETVKKWAATAGLTSASLVFLLFLYLSSTGAITITGYSPDSYCAGTIEEPCYAYVNFTANEDIYIYPTYYDPYGRDTPVSFNPGLKDWKLQRSWGSTWRTIDLDKTWSSNVKYAIKFSKGTNYSVRIVGYLEQPYQNVKWGFGPLDPEWNPIEGLNITINSPANSSTQNRSVLLNVTPHSNDTVIVQFYGDTTNGSTYLGNETSVDNATVTYNWSFMNFEVTNYWKIRAYYNGDFTNYSDVYQFTSGTANVSLSGWDDLVITPVNSTEQQVEPTGQSSTVPLISFTNNENVALNIQLNISSATYNKTYYLETFGTPLKNWTVADKESTNSTYNRSLLCMDIQPVGTYGRILYRFNNTNPVYNNTDVTFDCPSSNNATLVVDSSITANYSTVYLQYKGNTSDNLTVMLNTNGSYCANVALNSENWTWLNCDYSGNISNVTIGIIEIDDSNRSLSTVYVDNLYVLNTTSITDYLTVKANEVYNYSTATTLNSTYVTIGQVNASSSADIWVWFNFNNLPSGLDYSLGYRGII